VYSDALVEAHLRLYANQPGSLALIDRLEPDLIWLPAHLPVVGTLEQAGWRRVFNGPVSTVLSRRVSAPRLPPTALSHEARCFPEA
jgi:hypothetical protein